MFIIKYPVRVVGNTLIDANNFVICTIEGKGKRIEEDRRTIQLLHRINNLEPYPGAMTLASNNEKDMEADLNKYMEAYENGLYNKDAIKTAFMAGWKKGKNA
jgi:hypothetical protein